MPVWEREHGCVLLVVGFLFLTTTFDLSVGLCVRERDTHPEIPVHSFETTDRADEALQTVHSLDGFVKIKRGTLST